MRTLSCGVIIKVGDKILGCHTTGKRFEPGTFDLPKGQFDEKLDGVSEKWCAIRECEEETGLNLLYKARYMDDLGTYRLNPSKDVHLFAIELDMIEFNKLECKSTFTDRFGREMPEVDAYKMIELTEDGIKWFNKGMQAVLNKIYFI